MKTNQFLSLCLSFLFVLITIQTSFGQVINAGNGSYTTNFPGTDAAGRNSFPSGSPLLTGNAANKPVPTHDQARSKTGILFILCLTTLVLPCKFGFPCYVGVGIVCGTRYLRATICTSVDVLGNSKTAPCLLQSPKP